MPCPTNQQIPSAEYNRVSELLTAFTVTTWPKVCQFSPQLLQLPLNQFPCFDLCFHPLLVPVVYSHCSLQDPVNMKSATVTPQNPGFLSHNDCSLWSPAHIVSVTLPPLLCSSHFGNLVSLNFPGTCQRKICKSYLEIKIEFYLSRSRTKDQPGRHSFCG